MALELLQYMQSIGVHPNKFVYNSALRACATEDLWPVALTLLEDMRTDDLEANVVTYNAALAACDAAEVAERPDRIPASGNWSAGAAASRSIASSLPPARLHLVSGGAFVALLLADGAIICVTLACHGLFPNTF